MAAQKKVTVHNNPKWKEELKSNFHEIIIEKCSQAAINAVKGNEIIKVIFSMYREARVITQFNLECEAET